MILRRLVTDLASVSVILFIIWSTYFLSAQRVLFYRAQWFALCSDLNQTHESMNMLKERYDIIASSRMDDELKTSLMKRHLAQVLDYEMKLKACEDELPEDHNDDPHRHQRGSKEILEDIHESLS